MPHRQTGERPIKIRQSAKALVHIVTHRMLAMKPANHIQTLVNRRDITKRRRNPATQQTGTSRRLRAVNGMKQAALSVTG